MSLIVPPFWHPSLSTGFILDWDGVLAETKLDFSGIRNKYYEGKHVPILEGIKSFSPSRQRELWRDIYELEMAGADSATSVPGAFELVEWLNANSIPWSVVSRNCIDSIRLAASRIGFALPELTFSRDSGPVKPDPKALWMAASAMGVDYSGCSMVGDFVYDMTGARRAGMRSILVQRPEREWAQWADVTYDRVTDMVESLKNPESLVPWEYRDLENLHGAEWLDRAWKIIVLPDEDDPDMWSTCLELASLGVGHFSVSAEFRVTISQWKKWPGLSSKFLDVPLRDALEAFLRDKYPLVSVSCGGEGVRIPRDASTEEFLGTLI